jgi:hypothetical protein
MHGRLSLQSRLTACFLAFSVLPLLTFFLVFFPYLQGSMLKSRMAALEGLANANVSDLEQMGDSILREGERLALDQRVLDVLRAPAGEDAALAKTHAEDYLKSMVNESCRGAALVKAGWKVAASSNEEAYTGEALALLLGTDVSFSGEREVSGLLPSLSTPGKQSIYFTVPILSGSSLLGTLVREMPLGVLDRKTSSLSQGETGRMMLVDESGMILSHTDTAEVGKALPSDIAGLPYVMVKTVLVSDGRMASWAQPDVADEVFPFGQDFFASVNPKIDPRIFWRDPDGNQIVAV